MMESFRMTLQDAQNNANILPGTTLKYLVRNDPPSSLTATALSAINITQKSFGGEGVDMAMGSSSDVLCEGIAPIFQDADVVQVGYNPGSLMSHNDLYFTFLRTTPCSAYDGKFIAQNIQNQFGWNRIAVFSVSDDVDSEDGLIEFSQEAALSGLNLITTELFPKSATDLSENIAHAAQFEPSVILLMMPPPNTVMFLQQAYKKGLVKEGVTVIGTSYSAPSTMMSFFNATDDVASIMKGFMVFQANLNWTSTAKGKEFITRFQSWPNSISYAANGTPICHNDTDDEGWFTPHEQHINYNSSLPFVCGGIQPSQYNAANIYLQAGYVYDAMQALARGLDFMVRNATSPITKVSGRALKRIMVDHVQFEGVTGYISFSAGRTSSSNYGYGDRIDRVPYLISNFNNASFAISGNPFRTIGYYDGDLVYSICDPLTDMLCSKPVFNTVDNSIPADSPPPIYLYMPIAVRAIIIILASLFVLCSLVCILFTIYFRNNSALKGNQPTLQLGTLTGCLVCCAEMISETNPVNNEICFSRVWIVHLGFYLILGSIVAKVYRLHLVINTNKLKKVVISERYALCAFLVGLVVSMVYLIIPSVAGSPNVVSSFTTSITGQKTYQEYCQMEQPAADYFILGIELITLVTAVGLNWGTSNAPKKVNESAENIRSKAPSSIHFDDIDLMVLYS